MTGPEMTGPEMTGPEMTGQAGAGASRPERPGRRALDLAGLLALAAYCWWSAGTHPFSWPAYLAVGLPISLGLVAFATAGRPAARSEPRAFWPWLALLVFASLLEAASILAGHNDTVLPSLSTLTDQLMRWQGLRAVLFALWLLLGLAIWRPLARPAGRKRVE